MGDFAWLASLLLSFFSDSILFDGLQEGHLDFITVANKSMKVYLGSQQKKPRGREQF